MSELGWVGPVATLVVCGAHLQGQPLNPALMALGAVLVGAGCTAPAYRMYALPPEPGTEGQPGLPARPGLVRQAEDGAGAAIEVELYQVPISALGDLIVSVRPPLAIGYLLLDDGREHLGFVCESYAAASAPDITEFGNWRDYLELAPAVP